MRFRYYPVGVGLFLCSGLVALYAVRSGPVEPEAELVELPARFVKMIVEEPARPGSGAQAKREEGKVGRRDSQMQRAKGNAVDVKKQELDRQIAGNAGALGALRDGGDLDGLFGPGGLDANLSGGAGGLIGAKGTQTGAGGLAARGSGLGGGGTAEGLGGLGTTGYGDSYGGNSVASGYGSGGGSFGARAISGRMLTAAPPVASGPLSKDWDHVGHNPTELAERDWLSTFSIDVDTASYTQARRQIKGSVIPAPASVRTEEFVNYFRYDYPEPERGRPFSITMDGAEHPWRSGHHILRVGIKGSEQHERARRPVHLTFLVDVSGSMRSQDKLPLAKLALQHLVRNLEEGDTVALVTYAGSTRVVLEPTDAANVELINWSVEQLQNGGGTSMGSGMQLAYALADRMKRPGEESRVVVLSDGDANIGASSHEQILSGIQAYANKGITLSTVGFGTGNYRDALMEQLADKGDGNYSYVDSYDEAVRVFGEDLGATMRTIARDVKIQVEFNRDTVIAYKLVGYENREIADKDFRNDKVDAGEVGAGHTVTALYDVILRDQPTGSIATVRVRHKEPGPDVPATETAVDLPARAVSKVFEAGGRDLRRAWGSASFAEKLRGADELAEVDWETIARTIERAARPDDERDAELVTLVRSVQTLQGHSETLSNLATGQASPPVILGALDRALIDAVVQRHGNQLRYCYQRELTKNPSLGGEVVVKFVVSQDGTVSSSTVKSSTMGNTPVESCLSGRFSRMQFPAPKGGGIAIVNYPMVFTPA